MIEEGGNSSRLTQSKRRESNVLKITNDSNVQNVLPNQFKQHNRKRNNTTPSPEQGEQKKVYDRANKKRHLSKQLSNDEESSFTVLSSPVTPGVTPYWKVAAERGMSPPLTRSTKKKSRKSVNFELESSLNEDNTQPNLALIFSPPDNKKREKIERQRQNDESKNQTRFALTFSPPDRISQNKRELSLEKERNREQYERQRQDDENNNQARFALTFSPPNQIINRKRELNLEKERKIKLIERQREEGVVVYLSPIHDSVANCTGLTNDASLKETMQLQGRDTGILRDFGPEDGHRCEEQICDSNKNLTEVQENALEVRNDGCASSKQDINEHGSNTIASKMELNNCSTVMSFGARNEIHDSVSTKSFVDQITDRLTEHVSKISSDFNLKKEAEVLLQKKKILEESLGEERVSNATLQQEILSLTKENRRLVESDIEHKGCIIEIEKLRSSNYDFIRQDESLKMMLSNVEAEKLKLVNDDSAKSKNLSHICETLNTCKREIYDLKLMLAKKEDELSIVIKTQKSTINESEEKLNECESRLIVKEEQCSMLEKKYQLENSVTRDEACLYQTRFEEMKTKAEQVEVDYSNICKEMKDLRNSLTRKNEESLAELKDEIGSKLQKNEKKILEYEEKIEGINKISDMRKENILKLNDELNVVLQTKEEMINMNDAERSKLMKKVNCYKEERQTFKEDISELREKVS